MTWRAKTEIILLVTVLLLLGADQIIYLLQPLRAFSEQFERLTGIGMPKDYKVLHRTGNLFSKKMTCSLQFSQASSKELLRAIRNTTLYNDSAIYQRITLTSPTTPDQMETDTLRGVWMENDSSVYFVNNFFGVRSPMLLITHASIDKRSMVFDGVMLPMGTEFLVNLKKTKQSASKKIKPNSARGQSKK
jgi:hypothetical protein